MNLKIKYLIVFFTLNVVIMNWGLNAQSEALTEQKSNVYADWQVGVLLGISSYEGDVLCFKEDEINAFTEANFAFGLNLFKRLNDRFRLGLQYVNTSLTGSDAAFTSGTGHKERGFSFKNNINEFAVILQYEPFAKKSWKASPYLSGGIAYAFGKSNTDYRSGSQASLREQLISKDITEATSSSFGIPLGLGIVFKASDKVSVNLDAALRFGLNDFIDGVSNSGNSEINDYYGIGGFTFVYHIGKPKSEFVNTIKEY
jgi:opacity protein-like surface antigen